MKSNNNYGQEDFFGNNSELIEDISSFILIL